MEGEIRRGLVSDRSWWLSLYQPNGDLIWEGLVEARHQSDEQQAKTGLLVNQQWIPREIQHFLRTLPQFQARWQPTWEQVPLKQIPESTS